MMFVETPGVPVVVPTGVSKEIFAPRLRERLGFSLLGLLVAVLAVVMFSNSNNADANLKSISDSGSTSYNMVVTQHESLVFAVTFEQWLSGTVMRRDLQIRRALLAQRLAVSDNTGVTNGMRLPAQYFVLLGVLDDLVEAGPPGFLPPDDRIVLRSKSADVLKNFTYESREMMRHIFIRIDDQTRKFIDDENTRRTNQYVDVLLLLALMAIVTGFLAVARHRGNLMVGAWAKNERRELEEIRAALKRADVTLESRLDQERMDRLDREWIDTEVGLISLQMKGTVVPDEIAELMVESLGRVLGADIAIGYWFTELERIGYVKQWHRRTDTQVEETLFVKYESRLSTFVKRLWSSRRVIIVADSHLVNFSRDPLSDLLTDTQEHARSWVLAPVADGLQVLGYVLIAMVKEPRVWLSAEVALIQKVASNAANACIHARVFSQAMRIAENDAVVNRLVELDKVKDGFIENMNHELRTPLTSIIGYMEMIVSDVDPDVEPVLASSLNAIQRNAIRLQSLIENMMQVSRTNFNDAPLVVSTVDIGHVLGDAIKSMELVADSGGVEVTLRLDSPAGDLVIDGEINQLEQVFINLMSNAIKFTLRGGTVTVVARRIHVEGDYVEVKVIDTGIGIPHEEFPDIFKRFFRASTATQSAIPGFGIGLSLVHSIVREHHGTITFDSTVGLGTVFTVTLPARYLATNPADVDT
jgi:signal transduction histidine kinase